MPIDPQKVALAMSRGMSAVCATCARYWEAREKGIPGDSCTSKERCGSPLVGDTFHEYDGPMKGALHLWCFVCGSQSKYGLKVLNRPDIVGACKDHVSLVYSLRPVGKDFVGVPEIKSSNGALPKIPQFSKNALIDTIVATEQEWSNGEN